MFITTKNNTLTGFMIWKSAEVKKPDKNVHESKNKQFSKSSFMTTKHRSEAALHSQ